MRQSISELHNMTESEKRYRINERIEEFHASNGEWDKVLQDKWRMLVNFGGSL